MNFHDEIKALQNAFHDLVNKAQDELETYAAPALAVVAANGGKIILGLAEGVLTAAIAGTPWAALESSLIASAEAQGITLAKEAATAILNLVKSNLVAKGVPTA